MKPALLLLIFATSLQASTCDDLLEKIIKRKSSLTTEADLIRTQLMREGVYTADEINFVELHVKMEPLLKSNALARIFSDYFIKNYQMRSINEMHSIWMQFKKGSTPKTINFESVQELINFTIAKLKVLFPDTENIETAKMVAKKFNLELKEYIEISRLLNSSNEEDKLHLVQGVAYEFLFPNKELTHSVEKIILQRVPALNIVKKGSLSKQEEQELKELKKIFDAWYVVKNYAGWPNNSATISRQPSEFLEKFETTVLRKGDFSEYQLEYLLKKLSEKRFTSLDAVSSKIWNSDDDYDDFYVITKDLHFLNPYTITYSGDRALVDLLFSISLLKKVSPENLLTLKESSLKFVNLILDDQKTEDPVLLKLKIDTFNFIEAKFNALASD